MTTPPDPMADQLRAALEEDAFEDAADAALLARVVDKASAQVVMPSNVVSIAPRRRPSRTLRIAVPVAAAFAASIALAAIYANKGEEPRPPATKTIAPPEEPKPTAPPAQPVESAKGVSIDDLPTANVPDKPAPAHVDAPSAAELFTQANAERRAGEVDKAVDLYKKLLSSHPNAAESRASRVSLGRLLLDKKGDPSGALAQFDAYLASGGGDALAEEARVGRASALQRLGRGADEKRAWEELLQHHPQSVHAPRAKERLDARP